MATYIAGLLNVSNMICKAILRKKVSNKSDETAYVEMEYQGGMRSAGNVEEGH